MLLVFFFLLLNSSTVLVVLVWIGYSSKSIEYFMQNRKIKNYTKGLVFYFVAFLCGRIHLVVLQEIIALYFEGHSSHIKWRVPGRESYLSPPENGELGGLEVHQEAVYLPN